MQSTRSVFLLATCAAALAGCELIVHFDDSRLDASADATTMDASDVHNVGDATDIVSSDADAGGMDAADVPSPDVQPADAMDAQSPDVPTPDAMDVQSPDVQDVQMPDVQDVQMPDVQPEDVQPEDVPVDVPKDTATADDVSDAASTLVAVNGCDPATATDLTADATPTIGFPGAGLMYSPPCVRIHVGQSVTFSPMGGSDFDTHPLTAGTVSGGTATPDPSSPIGSHTTGTTDYVVAFPDGGTFGFYCAAHFASGMVGAVYVVP